MTNYRQVLVVDDDDGLREMIALLLEASGYQATEAVDGIDALEQLEHGSRPALVLLDLRMPRMNGIEVLRALHARAKQIEVPVVVLTGDVGAIDEALAAGAAACLRKPVDAKLLLDSVKQYETRPG